MNIQDSTIYLSVGFYDDIKSPAPSPLAQEWQENLKEFRLTIEAHPDGETIVAVCAARNILTECHICNLFEELPDLWKKYQREWLTFRGNDYSTIFEAEASGGVYRLAVIEHNSSYGQALSLLEAAEAALYAAGRDDMVIGLMMDNNQFLPSHVFKEHANNGPLSEVISLSQGDIFKNK